MPTPSSRRRKARVTSSRTRSARKPATPKPVSTGSPRARAARARVATRGVTNSASRPSGGTARVTSSASRDAGPSKADAKQWQKYQKSAKTSGTGQKGAPGTADAPKNATGSRARTPGGQIAANKLKRALRLAAKTRNAATTLRKVARVGKAGVLGTVAAAGLSSTNTADGTLKAAQKRGDTKKTYAKDEKKAKAAVAQRKKADARKPARESFDNAFRDARRAGVKTFTWRGKKYTTKMK